MNKCSFVEGAAKVLPKIQEPPKMLMPDEMILFFFLCENPETSLKGREGPEVTDQKDSLNYCMGPEGESEAKVAGLATTDLFTRPVQIMAQIT